MRYKALMKQSEYRESREAAQSINEVVRKEFKSELTGIKRYVDPRIKGVSTKYLLSYTDRDLVKRLVKFISEIPVKPGYISKVSTTEGPDYIGLRLTVKKAA